MKFPSFKNIKKPQLFFGLSIVILLLLAGTAWFRSYQLQKELEIIKANPQNASPEMVKEQTQKIVDRVGKLMELPIDEEPTIATVADIEKLANQPFFAKAQNGDKVLIYTKAKRAILYRPDTNKIIDIAPVNVDQTQSATESAKLGEPTPTPEEITIVLYNGTIVTGLTRDYEKALLEKLPYAKIVGRDNALNTDYKKSRLIDLTGNNKTQADDIAQKLDMIVTVLPDGEEKPENGQLLIILGSDVTEE